jgi:hypothetical protein
VNGKGHYSFFLFISLYSAPGPTGWCATCNVNASRGEEGNCITAADEMTDSEMSVVTASSNWGYCHASCKEEYVILTNVADPDPDPYITKQK